MHSITMYSESCAKKYFFSGPLLFTLHIMLGPSLMQIALQEEYTHTQLLSIPFILHFIIIEYGRTTAVNILVVETDHTMMDCKTHIVEPFSS